MRLAKILVVFVFTLLFIAACSQTETTGPASPEPPAEPSVPAAPSPAATPDVVAIGESKYKEYCAKCHKDDGTGGEVVIEGKTLKAENLVADKMKKEPDSEYIEYMEKGIPDEGMPSFKDVLSEDEMKAVVKFIREKLQTQ